MAFFDFHIAIKSPHTYQSRQLISKLTNVKRQFSLSVINLVLPINWALLMHLLLKSLTISHVCMFYINRRFFCYCIYPPFFLVSNFGTYPQWVKDIAYEYYVSGKGHLNWQALFIQQLFKEYWNIWAWFK